MPVTSRLVNAIAGVASDVLVTPKVINALVRQIVPSIDVAKVTAFENPVPDPYPVSSIGSVFSCEQSTQAVVAALVDVPGITKFVLVALMMFVPV